MGEFYIYIKALLGQWLFYASAVLTVYSYIIQPTIEKIRKKPIINIPYKVLLVIAMLCFLIANYHVWLEEHHSVEIISNNNTIHDYYLVSKDGKILKNIKSDKYGLFIKKKDRPLMDGNNDELVPTYIIRFNKPPTDFDIITQEAAIPKREKINSNEWQVQFRAIGFCNPTIECNFKILLY